MATFYFTKQPSEQTTFGIDASGFREIQLGETITSATVTVTDRTTGVAVAGIYVSHDIETGKIVRVRVTGGTDGAEYVITVLGTTDAGHIRESDVVMSVKEKP